MYIHFVCVRACVRACASAPPRIFFVYCLGLISVVFSALVFQIIVSLDICMGCPLIQAPSDGGNLICNDIA